MRHSTVLGVLRVLGVFWILTVQLYAGGDVLTWQVSPHCPEQKQWLIAARQWADEKHVKFTAISNCGYTNDWPRGYTLVQRANDGYSPHWVFHLGETR